MMNHITLAFHPVLPWPLLAISGGLGLLLIFALIWQGRQGSGLRIGALLLLFGALFDPRFVNEEREKLEDVVALVIDRSGSQSLAGRAGETDAAAAEIEQQLKARPNTILRRVEVQERDAEGDGTRLFESLNAAIADVPPERLAGIIAITDGMVHDAPPSLRALGFNTPFHGLITGNSREFDRRIEIVEAPRFGIVGKEVQAAFKIISDGAPAATLQLRITRNGEPFLTRSVRTGTTVRMPLKIDRAGTNLFEASINAEPGELTPLNNTQILPIEGVRDKLQVLLISGEPHAGERAWRNLLKADPNVDLVHFTILRPPEKQDGTPTGELSLIAFPTRRLFMEKIDDFDLIIFDRYSNQTFLPTSYFENMVRYVRSGRPILFAAGPEILARSGLMTTPLRDIMPVIPSGSVIEGPFRPRVTDIGERHPVTRKLEGATSLIPGEEGNPAWAPWYRLIASSSPRGTVLMSGAGQNPLLVLNREEKGRVAMFLSDQVWLWARGFEGGGPYLDLLRRVVHWLMKEADLEEEALTLTARGRILIIERRTIGEAPGDFALALPNGEKMSLTPTQTEPGRWSVTLTARRPGLYSAENGKLTAYANVGPPNPKEFLEVVSTTDRLAGLANESGGSVRRIAEDGKVIVPRVVDIHTGSRFYGSDFIGLKPSEASIVRGISMTALATGGLGLILLVLPLLLTWLGEGRKRKA